jgi:hypothetical protein
MENQIKTFTHTAPLGETISYQFRNILEIVFIQMEVNFDTLKHISFARDYIASIPGIRAISAVEFSKDGGRFYFGLNVGYNAKQISKDIEKEFITYFKTLDKHQLNK